MLTQGEGIFQVRLKLPSPFAPGPLYIREIWGILGNNRKSRKPHSWEFVFFGSMFLLVWNRDSTHTYTCKSLCDQNNP